MALPMSSWFLSSLCAVASLSGRFPAALTIYSRVQVMWSSHSLRMAWLNSTCEIFLLVLLVSALGGAANAADALRPTSATVSNAASERREKACMNVNFILSLLLKEGSGFGACRDRVGN